MEPEPALPACQYLLCNEPVRFPGRVYCSRICTLLDRRIYDARQNARRSVHAKERAAAKADQHKYAALYADLAMMHPVSSLDPSLQWRLVRPQLCDEAGRPASIDRRKRSRKRRPLNLMKALTLTLILAAVASAQQIAVWNDASKSYVAVKAGAGIKIDMAAKTISATAATPKVRMYGVVLPYQSISRGWALPSGAVADSIAIWCNGLRYTLGIDYVVSSGLITAISTSRMTADMLVVVDYTK